MSRVADSAAELPQRTADTHLGLRQLLPAAVPESLDELIHRQKGVFTREAHGLGTCFVVLGTGALGKMLAEGLQALALKVECFCDNNSARQGTTCLDRPVLPVAEAVERYNGRAVFVVGVFHGQAAQEQLRALGCGAVVSAATLCRHFGPPLTPLLSIDRPAAIYAQSTEVARCASLWADEKSRAEYLNVISWFLATEQRTLLGQDPPESTYFPDGLWTSNDEENFVDCGAFDGDSVLLFLKKMGGKFRAVTAYEPDPHNAQACEDRISMLSEDQLMKIRVVNAAVGEQAGEIRFSDLGAVNSSVGGAGNLAVRCVRLDEQFRDDPPTFLKMDIEGYELEALTGGREMIATHAPILAITTYHKAEHLWQIPLLIHSFRPDYRFYLRRYAEDCWETVCYAVPPWRAIN